MKELLKKAGITQSQLAIKLHVTQSLVSQWIRGICQPNIEQLPIIAETLNVEIVELINTFKKS